MVVSNIMISSFFEFCFFYKSFVNRKGFLKVYNLFKVLSKLYTILQIRIKWFMIIRKYKGISIIIRYSFSPSYFYWIFLHEKFLFFFFSKHPEAPFVTCIWSNYMIYYSLFIGTRPSLLQCQPKISHSVEHKN